jgi:hypothetical protein
MSSEPQILFLAGVFIADCKTIEDVTTEKFLYEPADVTPSFEPVVLPRFYEGKTKWPIKMTALCPMCQVRNDNPPKTVLITISRVEDGTPKCSHNGLQFNSWTCAAFFIRYHAGNDSRLKLNLTWLYSELEGKPCYGGELDIGSPPWNIRDCGVGLHSRAEWIRLNEIMLEKSQAQAKMIADGIESEVLTLIKIPLKPDVPEEAPVEIFDDDNDEFAI